MRIDINCDMGEGYPNDALLMPYISSANIACGFHAGDESTMQATVIAALSHQVAIGAHPGFDDKANFGRTEIQLTSQEIYGLVTTQIQMLNRIALNYGARLNHVKPHGALYNMSARDPLLAHTIAQAVYDQDPSLLLFGLSGSCSLSAAKKMGLRTVGEVFADRSYQDDGALTSRSSPGALITNEAASLQQVLQMIEKRTVSSVNGKQVPVDADSICIHGDGEQAVAFAKLIYQSLQTRHIDITHF